MQTEDTNKGVTFSYAIPGEHNEITIFRTELAIHGETRWGSSQYCQHSFITLHETILSFLVRDSSQSLWPLDGIRAQSIKANLGWVVVGEGREVEMSLL